MRAGITGGLTPAARHTNTTDALFRIALLLVLAVSTARADVITVGSKDFTESVVLGETLRLLLDDAGFEVAHKRRLGDAACFQALVRGDVDCYVEYTGTLRRSIFAGEEVATPAALDAALAAKGLKRTASLGFENSYAIGVTEGRAAELGLAAISDLAGHPGLRFAFDNSFLGRGDGWPGLRDFYRLPQTDVRGMTHELSYDALRTGQIDAIELYTTDAEIVAEGLVALDDDRGFFPEYRALVLYREGLPDDVVATLRRLEGTISAEQMRGMNYAVKFGGRSEPAVAAEFVRETFEADVAAGATPSRFDRIARRTREHLLMVAVAVAAATLLAVPLGVAAYKFPTAGRVIVPAVGVLQTVPSLALLAVLVPLFGVTATTAIVALFLYGLLPIVRNTHAGLTAIPDRLVETARAIGLPSRRILLEIELPLATPIVLAGVRTATVIAIGFATLGAFVGAGGYGQPILTGIDLRRQDLILEGAVPAALMAVLVEVFYTSLGRLPVGHRMNSRSR